MTITRFYLVCFVLLASSFYCSAQTEVSTDGKLSFIKLGNGLNAIVSTNPASTALDITCYVKTGSILDPDSMSGAANILQHIVAAKINQQLSSPQSALNSSNAHFHSFANSEHSVFKFSIDQSNLSAVLAVLTKNLFYTVISESDIDAASLEVQRDLQKDSINERSMFNQKIMQVVFRKDFEKLNPAGNTVEYPYIDVRRITAFYKRYYVPNNTLLAVSGNVSYTVLRQSMQGDLTSVLKSDFDYEQISKIMDLRPMVYTSHFIFEAETEQPEFNLCWQFPGAVTNTESSYAAYLLSAMLNDKNNFIQVKARKLGCKKLSAQYEANNFSGMLRIVLQPDKNQLVPTLQMVTAELARLEKTLINETMMNAGKLQFKREWALLQNSSEYPEWVARYWAYKDDSYFTGLLDTVMGVKEDEMKKFVVEYLNQKPHVTGLYISKADRAALKIDSLFTDISEAVGDYVFKFRLNICDLEGEENFVMQRNLLQFLKANSDVNLQINGLADEGEFNQAADDSVLMFIDSLSTFRKTMPEKIKKGYLKPEMMRAMKMLKYFYDNGIEAERLSGTCMKFTSDNNTEAADNMKCTVTLDKLRKAPSVYEFHYGKKKQ